MGCNWLKSILASGVMTLVIYSAAAQAAPTYEVTSLSDSPTASCTLRKVVEALNQSSSICLKNQTASVASIEFTPSLSGQTIVLEQKEITINKPVLIDGGTGSITIDADRKSRIFTLTANTTLKNLTLKNGVCGTIDTISATGDCSNDDAGGAIYTTAASLTIENSTLLENYGSGRFVGGGAIFAQNAIALKVTDSILSDNHFSSQYGVGGGAISIAQLKESDLVIENSTFSANSTTDSGAAIRLDYGNMRISNSTFTANSANKNGGAIYANTNSYLGLKLNLSNSTLSSNSAYKGGAIYTASNISTINNSTLVGNHATDKGMYGGGGALFGFSADTPITIISSILVGNTQGNNKEPNNCYNFPTFMLSSATSNNILDTDCMSLLGAYSTSNTEASMTDVIQTVTVGTETQPQLADNGCNEQKAGSPNNAECVKTISLLKIGSNPAINNGITTINPITNANITTDQRGYSFVGSADIGAFEIQQQLNIINGVCGSAANTSTYSTPSTNLCAVGSSANVNSVANNFSWQCNGNAGGTSASCSAIRQYRLTYSANGGINQPSSLFVDANRKTTVASKSNMTKTGYVFTGWNTSANGTGSKYSAGSSYTMPTRNITLYAQWARTSTDVLFKDSFEK